MPKKREEAWEEPWLPARYVQIYLVVAEDRGADIDTLLANTGLSRHTFDRPDARVNYLQMHQLMCNLLDQVGDHGLGIDVGLRQPPTAFGNLGYALLCSDTMNDVIELCLRFWLLLSPSISLCFLRGPQVSSLEVERVIPFPQQWQHFPFEVTLASLHRGLHVLTQVPAEEVEIWFRMPEPAYAQKAHDLLGRVRYNMPANQFRFPTRLLDERLPMSNPVGLKFAVEQCERELALLRNDGRRLHQVIKEKLVYGRHGYPTLEDICEQLHLTPRTLRRRLEEEGTNFKLLSEEVKRRDAVRMLDNSNLKIQRIAELLGYQDPANFTRAFRKWTGLTPKNYQKVRGLGKHGHSN